MPTPTSAAVAITAMTTVLNGKSAPLRMPNAAPVFRACVKSKKPGDDRHAVVQRQRGADQRLRRLIDARR